MVQTKKEFPDNLGQFTNVNVWIDSEMWETYMCWIKNPMHRTLPLALESLAFSSVGSALTSSIVIFSSALR